MAGEPTVAEAAKRPVLDVGIHLGISHEAYHADPAPEPSLSRSVAWMIARRSPIHGWLAHPRLNPDFKPAESNRGMDFGTLGHALLLGNEDRIDVGEWSSWQKKAARDFRDKSRAAGRIPTLRPIYEKAQLLRKCALLHIAEAGYIDDFANAKTEVTVIAKLEDQYLRARFDALRIDPAGAAHRQHSEIAAAFDIKITKDASLQFCSRQIGQMGYDIQPIHYLKTLSAADKKFAGKVVWTFFFFENEFPFCLTPVELTNEYLAIGGVRWSRAWEAWKRGMKEDKWPGYADGAGAFQVGPPRYLSIQELEGEL
jgi:hypothetical protein